MKRSSVIIGGVATTMLALVPVFVFWGARGERFRFVAGGLAGIYGLMLLLRWSLARKATSSTSQHPTAATPGAQEAQPSRPRLAALAWLPFFSLGLALLSYLQDSRSGLVLIPVAVSALLLVAFGTTLWRGPPMIERFARLIDPDLSPAEQRWCRTWTLIWCGFFVMNGALAAYLGTLDDLLPWTTYCSLISYLLIGLLLMVEYVARKRRFRRFDDHPIDRWLARLFSQDT